MNDINEVKLCDHCKSYILLHNFSTHSVHCQRYFYLCLKCHKPIKCSESKEHDATNHVIVQCENCSSQFEKWYLSSHLNNDCPFRKVKCKICDIDIEITQIEEHEDYCGSRTEKCSDCQKYVMIKNRDLHINSNHALLSLNDELGPSPTWRNGRRTFGDFLPDFILKQSHHAL